VRRMLLLAQVVARVDDNCAVPELCKAILAVLRAEKEKCKRRAPHLGDSAFVGQAIGHASDLPTLSVVRVHEVRVAPRLVPWICKVEMVLMIATYHQPPVPGRGRLPLQLDTRERGSV